MMRFRYAWAITSPGDGDSRIRRLLRGAVGQVYSVRNQAANSDAERAAAVSCSRSNDEPAWVGFGPSARCR